MVALRHGRHYRVVDIKFSTLKLLKDGGLGADGVAVMAQAWTYNEALGRLQGYTPPAAYVAGRGWRQGQARGDRCWEKLARIARETYVRSWEEDLASVVARGMAWIRRLRTEGAEWRVLPIPSVPELWPNMKADQDFPWHAAKTEIAKQLAELTLLPRVNRDRRAAAHSAGITRWATRWVGALLNIAVPYATAAYTPTPASANGRTRRNLEPFPQLCSMLASMRGAIASAATMYVSRRTGRSSSCSPRRCRCPIRRG